LLVVALSVLTFGLYAYYWLYKTTDELREESGRDDLHPIVDLLLALVTFGLWGLWAGYRNAKITHELFEEIGAKHSDRSLPVAAFGALSFVSGWAWLVSVGLLQDDYNRLIDELGAEDALPAARPYEAARPAVRARVDVSRSPEPPPRAVEVEQPEPARRPQAQQPTSRWERAPSAPVFESSAPAPHVF
jgi:hypothetical protein